MVVRLSRFVGVFLLMMLALMGTLCAQEYCVTIHFPTGVKGKVACRFYANDSVPKLRHSTLKNGEAVFKGTASRPHLVELSHPSLPSPVCFFVENANIDVTVNLQSPSSSRITGSRPNSEYRYALEEWTGDVLQFVADNPSAVYTPYLVYTHLSDLAPAYLGQALSLMHGPATTTYHYRQLQKKATALLSTTEGMRMPDFEFVDDNGQPLHFDSVRCDSIPSVILFTATFSQKGREIADQIRNQYPQLRLHVVNIDKHPLSWDAPYLEMLAVDRIPYMIYLSPEGIIHTRDARIWEFARILSERP